MHSTECSLWIDFGTMAYTWELYSILFVYKKIYLYNKQIVSSEVFLVPSEDTEVINASFEVDTS